MLNSALTSCPRGSDISVLLDDIDCKLANLGKTLYGNTVFMLNTPVSAITIIDLLHYKRILTFRQINPDYASGGCMSDGELIGDVVQWNDSNLIHRDCCIGWFNRIIREGISIDTLFADIIAANSIITIITVLNVTANPVQIVITLTNGTELFNEYIDASGMVNLTLNIPVTSLSGINVTSLDWNGAEINLSLTVENPF